jgi:hypothetical protein
VSSAAAHTAVHEPACEFHEMVDLSVAAILAEEVFDNTIAGAVALVHARATALALLAYHTGHFGIEVLDAVRAGVLERLGERGWRPVDADDSWHWLIYRRSR